MGVVNVTPDSFSDGGRFLEPARAIEQGLKLVEEGADILDVGAESSRPGSRPISPDLECDRILPVISQLRKQLPLTLISVDTWKANVALAALQEGADLINDIRALQGDPEMAPTVADFGAAVVLMQMRGLPEIMHHLGSSSDIVGEVCQDLRKAVSRAKRAGIGRDKIVLDPGIGFGKTTGENLILLNRLQDFRSLKMPLLIGTSRKSFLGAILKSDVGHRLMGTVASSVAAILGGADLLRVHDVSEVKEAASVADAILAERLLVNA